MPDRPCGNRFLDKDCHWPECQDKGRHVGEVAWMKVNPMAEKSPEQKRIIEVGE